MSSSSSTLRVAAITGASSGIGRETAIALARAGWSLVLFGRRAHLLRDTQNACPDPEACLVVEGDVSKEEDVVRLFAAAVERFGRVDLLFNNAGISSLPLPLEETPLSDFMDVINTNVVGAFLCTREAIKTFKSQNPSGGRIINNGSIAAHTPRPHAAPYTTSKHALTGLTKQTALEGRTQNIAVTQIDIGNAHTTMASPHTTGALQADGQVRPEPTFEPRHVADAVAYVAGLPLNVSVPELVVMATGMPYVGRG